MVRTPTPSGRTLMVAGMAAMDALGATVLEILEQKAEEFGNVARDSEPTSSPEGQLGHR